MYIVDNMSFVSESNPLDQFEEIKQLGEGTYGVVFLVRNKKNDELVALKKFRIDSDDEGVCSTAIREISLLMSLRHPNIVHLQQVLCRPRSLTMVFEYLEYDLKKYMESKIDPLSLDEIK